ncbi:Mechanosensitive ion channel MscS [Macleaya cordata]|uniref:Mechanosensitive ion channel MscS n=1 Tax=Macleaya cordata TaxID=56857 RepID=A0A200QD01_MACCD|nr:Mechanosensitive ion channel MscS [Macleaya cordata]
MDANGIALKEKKETNGVEVVLTISGEEASKQKDHMKDPSSSKTPKESEAFIPPRNSKDLTTGAQEVDNLKSKVQMSTFMNCPSPEISMPKVSSSPRKPPKIPDNVTPRSMLTRSVFSKPKSRFVEPSAPISSDADRSSSSPYRTSPNNKLSVNTPRGGPRTAPVTPKTPFLASPGGEEEDEEIYKIENAAPAAMSVQVCIWLSLVLLTWLLLFNSGVKRSRNTTKFLNSVTRCLIALLNGAVIWLVKTVLMKILAGSFHVNTFFDRIQESIFHQYVLQTLSGPPLMELAEKVGSAKSTGQLSFRSTKKGDGPEVIDVVKLHKMKQEKVSAWTMRGLVNVIRTTGLSTISNTIDQIYYEEGGQKDREITSEWEAKAAAYRIFRNVAKPTSKYIDEEDLMRFLSKEEVDNVLPLFEGAVETGKIKKSALRNWVVKVYLERKSLAHSLNDTKTAVKQLNKLVSGAVSVAIIIVMLLIMGLLTTKVVVFMSSQMLLVVFMFGNTAKTIFEAIIFVFVMHPFDVGDRCVVDGVQMIVEEMNILTTIFLRYDNEKIYYPNSVLSTKPISNFYRSPNMGDNVEFSIDVSTTIEKVGALKSRVKAYIDGKPQHWQSNHSVVVKEIENLNKMKMALFVTHTMNHQNMVEKNSRRTELVLELKKIFEDLSIKYHLLPQEVHLSYVGQAAIASANFRP